ncbi:hypothetical protein [Methylohalobius crimeensis]|uniref:hypothetical protein n=1 Tax=Methylohalobius crimeensis TaxID=244365 RepID=UPI0003B4CEE6|nr:hypothetical protein [Methylohalobius crimeensis]
MTQESGPNIAALTDALSNDATKQSQWRGFVRKNRLQNVPQEFAEVVTSIRDFLGPVAGSLTNKEQFLKIWKAPGPWR